MKELTIEQKAKAYDEVSKEVKDYFEGRQKMYSDVTQTLEYLFPELKESEDEKTKRILHSISSKISFHLRDIFTEEEFQCFDAWSHAWLEKQGKTSMGISEATKQKLEDSLNKALEKETPESCKEFLEKQDELDKDSEDEKIRQFLIHEVTETSDKVMSYRNMNKKAVLAWLEKQGEQKPAWSEEDERFLNVAINILNSSKVYTKSPDKYEDTISWLKSLRPQNWTKEDKERYISCLQRLSTGNPEQPETINSKWFKEHVYPQSTWKPSVEEVVALEHAINCYSGISPTNANEVFILEIMKERLKNLTK